MALSHEEARAFYDRFGSKQDWQRFYEDRSVRELVAHGRFNEAQSVLEFGCGTGRLAEMLLTDHLPATARYAGLEISATMTSLAGTRLARFGPRVKVRLTEGGMGLNGDSGTYDRFLATYVLDLLSEGDIRALLLEAHRALVPKGLLLLVSLTHGTTFFSRLVERAWMALYAIRPRLVGGCRPISLLEFTDEGMWQTLHHVRTGQFGLVSEVLVAERRPS